MTRTEYLIKIKELDFKLEFNINTLRREYHKNFANINQDNSLEVENTKKEFINAEKIVSIDDIVSGKNNYIIKAISVRNNGTLLYDLFKLQKNNVKTIGEKRVITEEKLLILLKTKEWTL